MSGLPGLRLGDAVTTTRGAVLRRHATVEPGYRPGRVWVAGRDHHPHIASIHERDTEVVTGVLVGLRTLANGTTSWEEFGTAFTPTERFSAALIVTGLRRAPVRVRIEDVQPAAEPASPEYAVQIWDGQGWETVWVGIDHNAASAELATHRAGFPHPQEIRLATRTVPAWAPTPEEGGQR